MSFLFVKEVKKSIFTKSIKLDIVRLRRVLLTCEYYTIEYNLHKVKIGLEFEDIIYDELEEILENADTLEVTNKTKCFYRDDPDFSEFIMYNEYQTPEGFLNILDKLETIDLTSEKCIIAGTFDYYESIVRNSLLIDKTMYIDEVINSGIPYNVVLRPRRFGKSLNLSMLKYFFDYNYDSRFLFSDKKIKQMKSYEEMNKYATIFISFKDIKGNNSEEIQESIVSKIKFVYENYHIEFPNDIPYIELLSNLVKKLKERSNREIVLLIDEYDIPIFQYTYKNSNNDYKAEYIKLLGAAIKGENQLQYAVLTGITDISKLEQNESLSMNNITFHGVCDDKYSDKFGFTYGEVIELLNMTNKEYQVAIKDYYNGYKFGSSTEIYNPYSISKYILNNERIMPYWSETGRLSHIVKNLLNLPGETYMKVLGELSTKGYPINNYELNKFTEDKGLDNLISMMLSTGYLTYKNGYVSIPNIEVNLSFQELIRQDYGLVSVDVIGYLIEKEIDIFKEKFEELLFRASSYNNHVEDFFKGFMACTALIHSEIYKIRTESEEGYGRTDLIMSSKNSKYPNIIFEFKINSNLEKGAKNALNQIYERKYYKDFIGETILVGICCYGKKCLIESSILNLY